MVVEPSLWGSADLLRANRERLMNELRRSLRRYEERYALSSAALEIALAEGRLSETAEICDWLIDWETYQALTDDERTGLE